MMRYVAGFLFSEDMRNVTLIEKKRPDWQAGKLNAIGGKIEAGEDFQCAMHREFLEETGLSVQSWKLFCRLSDASARTRAATFEVYFFVQQGNLHNVVTTTDEQVHVVDVNALLRGHCHLLVTVANLRWLVPMAMLYLSDDQTQYDIVERIGDL